MLASATERDNPMAYSASELRDTQPEESQWHDPPAELPMHVLLSHHLSLVSVIKARSREVFVWSRVDDDAQHHYCHA
jgi:hypothetical protein